MCPRRSCAPMRWLLQPPAGPVFLSIPLDDWDKPALGPAVVRTVSHRVRPDAGRLRDFAERLNKAQRPMLVFGPEVDRSGGLGGRCGCRRKGGGGGLWQRVPDRVSFPEITLSIGTIADDDRRCRGVLRGHDLVMVIGAQSSVTTRMWRRLPARRDRTGADHGGPGLCRGPHRSAKASLVIPVALRAAP